MKEKLELSEEEKINRANVYETLQKGMKITGKVKNIQPYGAFITISKGVDGLLPIKNMSVARIRTPEERVKKGDTVEVMIQDIDKNTGRITLSRKELLGTWEENIQHFKQGETTTGIVRNTTRGGIFIELMPNLVGLAEHKSGLAYGEKVKVYIRKISPENHKIKLVILD